MLDLHNGEIIRINSDGVRDWVVISEDRIKSSDITHGKKGSANYTRFHLFGGLWYEGDPTTDEPYGKYGGPITKGMLGEISIVGNINCQQDYEDYIKGERLCGRKKAL